MSNHLFCVHVSLYFFSSHPFSVAFFIHFFTKMWAEGGNKKRDKGFEYSMLKETKCYLISQ